MKMSDYFSPNYQTARRRFQELALKQDWQLSSQTFSGTTPEGEALTLEVAQRGNSASQQLLIVSSGLHGVEGFLGSAIQCALIDQGFPQWFPNSTGCLFLHALNPHGFAHLRRWDGENIDLNRNFLLSGQVFQGSPDQYGALNDFLNPKKVPPPGEIFALKAIAPILRYGFKALQATLPVGQYDYPQGLFFGGHHPSQTQVILAQSFPEWLQNVQRVIHLDLHTGLGKWGDYTLLIDESLDDPGVKSLQRVLGDNSRKLETSASTQTAYPMRGGLAAWCREKFPQIQYQFITVEFGTYPILKVLAALRAENSAHFWGTEAAKQRTRQQVWEMFAPQSQSWRETVVQRGIDLVQRVWQAF